MKNKAYLFVIALIGVLAIGGVIAAYTGQNNGTVIENQTIKGDYVATKGNLGEQTLGGFYSPDITGVLGRTQQIAKTSVYATTTLMSYDSGTTFYLSASGTTMILPKVADGLNFKFVVKGALDTGNVIIKSSEGDNIEGTLMVAGAVVDCDAEDQINFIVDGENIGDYVELSSDGNQWYIGDSGVLTSAKMTCTDPS